MTDCISVIHHPLPADIGTWEKTDQMTNVLHTESLQNVSCATGFLNADPFTLPDVDARLVAALVYHDCESGCINSWTSEIVKQVCQQEADTVIELTCWDLSDCEQTEEVDCYWIDDPCVRARMFGECLAKWAFAGKKKKFGWRDRDLEVSYLSEAKLCELLAQADAECDRQCGVNSRCLTYSCRQDCY